MYRYLFCKLWVKQTEVLNNYTKINIGSRIKSTCKSISNYSFCFDQGRNQKILRGAENGFSAEKAKDYFKSKK